MKKAIFAALAITIAATSPSFALKRSTAEKYAETSPMAVKAQCHVHRISKFSQIEYNDRGRAYKQKYTNRFNVTMKCPGWEKTFLGIRTDQLFGLTPQG